MAQHAQPLHPPPMPSDQPARIRCFVASHKDCPLPRSELYSPIYVGGCRPAATRDFLTDDRGEHIAECNPRYSELTAWYWIWRNVGDVDIVGLCHYRRYLLLDGTQARPGQQKLYMPPTPENLEGLARLRPSRRIIKTCVAGGVVTPPPIRLPEPIGNHYRKHHRSKDWEAFLEVLEQVSPRHARESGIFDTERHLHAYNMSLSSFCFFDEYMTLAMDVLKRLDPLIDYPADTYQQRIPAFLAERLFTLHLHVTKVPQFCAPTIVTEPDVY